MNKGKYYFFIMIVVYLVMVVLYGKLIGFNFLSDISINYGVRISEKQKAMTFLFSSSISMVVIGFVFFLPSLLWMIYKLLWASDKSDTVYFVLNYIVVSLFIIVGGGFCFFYSRDWFMSGCI